MTTTSYRVKRTQPEQSGPVRNSMATSPWGGAQVRAPGEMFTAASTAVCGVLENGVRTAYAVIDEYMRRGQEAARDVFNDPNRRGPMSDGSGNFGGGFNPGNNPLGMMMEQWMSAMQAWSQMLSSYMPPGWQQATTNPFAYGQASATMTAAAVMVKLSSARPAEVAVSLSPGADPAGLVCEPLRPESGSGTPIEAASIARDGAAIQVGVKIGAKQAPGRYHGYIRRKTGPGIAGELTVTIS